MPGDVVKRSLTSVESAVVLSISSQVKLQPTLHGGITVDGWVPWDSLKRSLVVEARDRVVYDEWIGTVEEVSDVFIRRRDTLTGLGRRGWAVLSGFWSDIQHHRYGRCD